MLSDDQIAALPHCDKCGTLIVGGKCFDARCRVGLYSETTLAARRAALSGGMADTTLAEPDDRSGDGKGAATGDAELLHRASLWADSSPGSASAVAGQHEPNAYSYLYDEVTAQLEHERDSADTDDWSESIERLESVVRFVNTHVHEVEAALLVAGQEPAADQEQLRLRQMRGEFHDPANRRCRWNPDWTRWSSDEATDRCRCPIPSAPLPEPAKEDT